MTELVSPNDIEAIVGTRRHADLHIGRLDTARDAVFILHPKRCLDLGHDLRECRFSIALDDGIDPQIWFPWRNQAVVLAVLIDGYLAPIANAPAAEAETSQQ